MSSNAVSEAAKAVVRRNTEEVQGRGDFRVFEELFADDFVDHTTQPGTSPDKAGVRKAVHLHPRGISRLSRGDPLAARGWRSPDATNWRLDTVRI
jgi:ketosteroid isomerase-like protein